MADFLVTSQGRTASYWFAAALNEHEFITCGHSKQNPPIPEYFGNASGVSMDDAMIEMDALSNDPVEYTRYLHKFGTTPVFGSVHAFGVEAADVLRDSGLNVAHLTRHPILRTSSLSDRNVAEIKQSKLVRERIYSSVTSNLTKFKELNALCDQAPWAEWAPFVAACFDVAYEALQIEKFDLVLQSERLTSDPDYFAWAVRKLAEVRVTQDYLETVFSMGQLNSSMDFRGSALDTFTRWPNWKKEVFKCFFIHYSLSNFEAFQYDIRGTLDVNSVDGEWSDRDSEAKRAVGDVGNLIRNCGVLSPPFVRSGSVVDAFVVVEDRDAENFAVELKLGTFLLKNNVKFLNKPIPSGTKLVKITFQAPVKPGTYAFEAISEHRSVWKTEIIVGRPDMRLSDENLLPGVDVLRVAIEPV